MGSAKRSEKALKGDRDFCLDSARASMRGGEAYVYWGIDVTACRIGGRQILFATDKIRDPIQRNHRSGRFYEQQELDEIKAIFPIGGVFVDIGANVGNHTLFVSSFLSPAKVIPFEPNPLAYRLLVANVALNGLGGTVDLDHIGVGLSDVASGGYSMTEQHKNLGGARMVAGEGEIEVIRGDQALAGVSPDLIKIDVEGMEMAVLEGLEQTIGRTFPKLLIEVDNANQQAFLDWVKNKGYSVRRTISRYSTNTNYFIDPPKAHDKVVG